MSALARLRRLVRVSRPLLAAALLLCPQRGFAAELSLALPAEIPSRATLLGWERITGEIETADELVVYELYVNPRRQQIYEVTHYRVTHLAREQGQVARRAETEKLVWHANPGKESPRCFELTAEGGWKRLAHGSPEYRWEMGMAMHVYGLHRRVVMNRGEE
jgi:hypothetical protein